MLLCELNAESAGDAGALALSRLAGLKECEGVPLGVLLTAPARAFDCPISDAEIEAWAEGAAPLVDAGARILGGGSGTTPRHLAAVARVLDRLAATAS